MEGSRKLGRVRSSCLLRRVTYVILFLVFTMRGKDPTRAATLSLLYFPSLAQRSWIWMRETQPTYKGEIKRNNSDQNGMEHGSVIHSNTISCMESNKQVQC